MKRFGTFVIAVRLTLGIGSGMLFTISILKE